ncbi:hypothetical protein FH609_024620 [Streptomyces sp. 3MP-14]|uniref:Uncharacterized protein n=1 Tax=Streptomyces mimosae TaxID=2586635 RepID=A0A5N6A1S2_9ACTN|nr:MULTISPECIES: hypothetical protein [Streptomyces]KAB8162192.1 hypothetical protein FH607_022115 [Streptomyces mimosae]KAB8173910.1 hypothetical protein FH609_024620 [Streptomyces sp. 3MP-14]
MTRGAIGAVRGAVPGYAVLLALLVAGTVFAHREGLTWLRLCGAALSLLALWRLVWHARARLTATGALLRVGAAFGEARSVPWHHIRLITVDAGGSEALLRDGERLRLPAPRGHLAQGPEAFDAAVARLRSAIPEAESGSPALSAPPAGAWTRRRLLLRWAVALVAVAVVAGWSLRSDQPWEAPWWPGSATLASVPDPCAVAEASLAGLGVARSGPEPAEQPTVDEAEGYRSVACQVAHDEARFTLVYRLHPWRGSAEAAPADAAGEYFGWTPYAGGGQDVEGTTWRREDTPSGVELSHRRSNVVITVARQSWALDGQPADAVVEASLLAAGALSALDD